MEYNEFINRLTRQAKKIEAMVERMLGEGKTTEQCKDYYKETRYEEKLRLIEAQRAGLIITADGYVM